MEPCARGPVPVRIGWAIAAVLVTIALGWQALYELDIRQCLRDSRNLLVLCMGPLDPWVLPLTVVGALVLAGIGLWRLVPPRGD